MRRLIRTCGVAGVVLALGLASVCLGTLPFTAGTKYVFKEPTVCVYTLEPGSQLATGEANAEWIQLIPANAQAPMVEAGRLLVLQLNNPQTIQAILQTNAVTLSRKIGTHVFILETTNALASIALAQRLAQASDIEVSTPVMRRNAELDGVLYPFPNDAYAYVDWIWNLDNRDISGKLLGPDLNMRAAWAFTRGAGITVAVGDLGVQASHPDLTNQMAGAPHFNYNLLVSDPNPSNTNGSWSHGTEVAGLIAAQMNNGIGGTGIAPEARLAGWLVFQSNATTLVSDDHLMDMFQYQSNIVSVQNHSWSGRTPVQTPLPFLSDIGISNTVTFGRGGKGSVLVRSGGNQRTNLYNGNDDGYIADPRAIAVAAIRKDGRVASYSTPGANLLVAAPSGDDVNGFPGLFTTDLVGTAGANSVDYSSPGPDFNNYVSPSAFGFSGTSAAAPQIAGVVALMLSINTNLTSREVQLILALAARHFDLTDPILMTNGAGLRVSYNQGYGVPDAAFAVKLSQMWSNRPAATSVAVSAEPAMTIPDDGTRVVVNGTGVPTQLSAIGGWSGIGIFPDVPTLDLPLVYVGQATSSIKVDLTNKNALIQNGGGPTSATKITRAANAGARAAIIFGNTNGTERLLMASSEFARIPSIFIDQNSGEGLTNLLATNSSISAHLQLYPAQIPLLVTNQMICEQVALKVNIAHPARNELRVTLLSPQGTRSVLQRVTQDTSAGPTNWTYYSKHHFFEASAGTWLVEASDDTPGTTGMVMSVTLTITGVPIVDSDHDGLDDNWEMAKFGTLAYGPRHDPDHDGYNNAFEQALNTNPNETNAPVQLDLASFWKGTSRFSSPGQMSWAGSDQYSYRVYYQTNISQAFNLVTNVPGKFPETEYIFPLPSQNGGFWRVEAVPLW